MSGESIYNVLHEDLLEKPGPYTGKYKKHMKEREKPTYSTFYEKGKEYDGTHPRYFKQRDAIIGPIVNDTIDPKNFLRAGEGVKHVVPPSHERKLFTKPPLDDGIRRIYGAVVPGGQAGPVSNGLLGDGQQKLSHGVNDLSETNGLGANGKPSDLEENIYADGKDRKVHPEFGKGLMKDGAGDGEAGLAQPQDTADGEFRRDQFGDYVNGGADAFEGQKNFVRSNILQVSNMVTKRRKDQPEHPTCRKSFARVPLYLGRVKQEIDDEKNRIKSLEEAHIRHQIQQMRKYVYRLDEGERTALLQKLKTQLNEKSTELNKMPFAKDTFNNVMRRAELEKDIKEIELSIAKLDKDAVFVYNSDPRCVNWTKDAALKEAASFAAQKSD